jgi:hypothetical protein
MRELSLTRFFPYFATASMIERKLNYKVHLILPIKIETESLFKLGIDITTMAVEKQLAASVVGLTS